MVINETMARTLWPNDDPIGKRIGFRGPNPNWREVVGVVGDVTFPSFGSSSNVDTPFEVYQPLAQTGTVAVNILLRTAREPDAVAADLRRAVAALDADLPVYGVVTATAIEQRQTANLRLLANVLGGFAMLGLVLAAVGIFGVVSYSTAQRAGELGLRMALGARQSVVLWLVLKQGVGLTDRGRCRRTRRRTRAAPHAVVDDAESSGAGALDHAWRLRIHGGCGAGRLLHSSLARIEDQSDARPAPRIAQPGLDRYLDQRDARQ